jgi:hypothetical protein
MSIFGVSEEKNRWLKERWKPLMGEGQDGGEQKPFVSSPLHPLKV